MTAQHLNLLDARLLPRRLAFSATQALLVTACVLLLTAGTGIALQMTGAAARAQAGARPVVAQAVLPVPPQGAADLQALRAELERLREFQSAQQRVLDALQSGSTNGAIGYGALFEALARQAGGPLWITAFAVSPAGDAIELEGRMLDAAVLPAYLRRLNGEAAFGGRPFAQLQIRSLADEPAAAGTETLTGLSAFALRSTPAAAGTNP